MSKGKMISESYRAFTHEQSSVFLLVVSCMLVAISAAFIYRGVSGRRGFK